jgi:hypothetical protein
MFPATVTESLIARDKNVRVVKLDAADTANSRPYKLTQIRLNEDRFYHFISHWRYTLPVKGNYTSYIKRTLYVAYVTTVCNYGRVSTR